MPDHTRKAPKAVLLDTNHCPNVKRQAAVQQCENTNRTSGAHGGLTTLHSGVAECGNTHKSKHTGTYTSTQTTF